jgi:hypothetical protein
MRNRQIRWWVAGAVAGIFLLGLACVGGLAILGLNPAVGMLISLGILFVASVAAAVGVSWSRR